MKQNRSGQEAFYPSHPQPGLLTISPEFGAAPANISDQLRLIWELQQVEIELTLQNKALLSSQQELMKSKIRYTELYDTLPMGYITLDSNGVVLNANLRFADMLCMQRSSLLNQQLTHHIVCGDREVFSRHLKDLDDVKTEQICELRMQKKNGTVFDVMMKTIAIADNHKKPERYHTAVLDISESKRLKKEQENRNQAEKMESIRVIAGGIAHDFNNILQVILGTVELELDILPRGDRTRAGLKRIKSAVFTAAEIILQFRSFSHRIEPDLRPTGIVSTVQGALKFLEPSISGAIEIESHFPDKEITVLADQNQVHQMLMNLFTNALQAMEGRNGILKIAVETDRLAQADTVNYVDLSPGEYVKITIKDTGPGIHPEIIHQVFDPYFTTRGLGNASGMGLTMVHAIVKNHKGAVTVDSRPGEGAAFTLLIPLLTTASN